SDTSSLWIPGLRRPAFRATANPVLRPVARHRRPRRGSGPPPEAGRETGDPNVCARARHGPPVMKARCIYVSRGANTAAPPSLSRRGSDLGSAAAGLIPRGGNNATTDDPASHGHGGDRVLPGGQADDGRQLGLHCPPPSLRRGLVRGEVPLGV